MLCGSSSQKFLAMYTFSTELGNSFILYILYIFIFKRILYNEQTRLKLFCRSSHHSPLCEGAQNDCTRMKRAKLKILFIR